MSITSCKNIDLIVSASNELFKIFCSIVIILKVNKSHDLFIFIFINFDNNIVKILLSNCLYLTNIFLSSKFCLLYFLLSILFLYILFISFNFFILVSNIFLYCLDVFSKVLFIFFFSILLLSIIFCNILSFKYL
jgi:hypothetical protein